MVQPQKLPSISFKGSHRARREAHTSLSIDDSGTKKKVTNRFLRKVLVRRKPLEELQSLVKITTNAKGNPIPKSHSSQTMYPKNFRVVILKRRIPDSPIFALENTGTSQIVLGDVSLTPDRQEKSQKAITPSKHIEDKSMGNQEENHGQAQPIILTQSESSCAACVISTHKTKGTEVLTRTYTYVVDRVQNNQHEVQTHSTFIRVITKTFDITLTISSSRSTNFSVMPTNIVGSLYI